MTRCWITPHMWSARGCWTKKFDNFAFTTVVLGRHVVFCSCVRKINPVSLKNQPKQNPTRGSDGFRSREESFDRVMPLWTRLSTSIHQVYSWITAESNSRALRIVLIQPFNFNIYNFTGVQASGVIIVFCDSAVSYGPKIIGPHSSGNFNDWLLKLKAGSKIWMVAMGIAFHSRVCI